MRYFIAAVAITLGSPLSAVPPPSHVIVDSAKNVASFYGIPAKLTISGLSQLRFPVKTRFEAGEDDPYPVYAITAEDGVEVEVTFDDDGKLYGADTASSNAVGPNGIGVGSSLSAVKAAWPNGVLLFDNEDGAFATYVTGTNILFRFDPRDLPSGAFDRDRPKDFEVPNDIKVQRISIYPRAHPVPEKPR